MSFLVALATTLLATILGTHRRARPVTRQLLGKGTVMALLISPMIVPVIISAVACSSSMRNGISPARGSASSSPIRHWPPLRGHHRDGQLSSFDKTLMRAGASCGAAPHTVFFKVVMPLILPA